MNLPTAPGEYIRGDNQNVRQQILAADLENWKKLRDIRLEGGERLILKSPDGTLYYFAVTNGGALTLVDLETGDIFTVISGDMSPFSEGGITKPVASAFTIADDVTAGHGTGTKADLATRGIEISNTRGAAASTQSLFYKAAVSSTLVSTTAYVAPNFGAMNSRSFFYGLALRDSTGKIDSFGLTFDAGVGNMVFYHHTFADISTAPTQSALAGGHPACGRPIWLRLAKVSTDFVFSVSWNGETYDTITTISATGFIGSTINDVGLILYNSMNNGSQVIRLDCYSFEHS